jgi:hypothetical protein
MKKSFKNLIGKINGLKSRITGNMATKKREKKQTAKDRQKAIKILTNLANVDSEEV